MSIRRLPSELINRIAAGEVVERPASALKELVENSLDASAKSVAIRLSAGGLDLVEVVDDGSGMSAPDMRLALERHATSKLPDDVIENVVSFGFRGEALPSIASVARLTLESRERGSDGWRIVIDHGELLGEGLAALPPGTRVRAEGLFDKVPARRKFLRSPRAEYAACLDVVKRLAMARPDVAFSVDHDGRLVLVEVALDVRLRHEPRVVESLLGVEPRHLRHDLLPRAEAVVAVPLVRADRVAGDVLRHRRDVEVHALAGRRGGVRHREVVVGERLQADRWVERIAPDLNRAGRDGRLRAHAEQQQSADDEQRSRQSLQGTSTPHWTVSP